MADNLPPNLPALKAGWSWIKLGDVVERMSNGCSVIQHKDKGDFPITRIETISFGNVDLNRIRYVNNISKEDIEKYQLHLNDILFSHINSDLHLGKTALFKLTDKTLLHGINLLLIRVNEKIFSDFLNYLFNYYRVKGEFLKIAQHAVNQSSINQKKLKNVDIPLPPLPEQKKIVEKIEELFSQLESGVASLKKAKEQLRLYRQAVLAFAFSGKLVREVGRRQKAVGQTEMLKAAEPKVKYNNNGLPNGWEWVKLSVVIDSIQYGTSDKAIGTDKGVPVLRMGNIQDGKLDYSNLKFFDKNYEDLKKYLLEEGDLLFNRTNSAELVGKSALYKKHHPKSIFASYLIRVKVNKSIYSSEFLNYYINSSFGREFIKSVVSQNVGQANVNGTKLKNINVPLVPLPQQTKIVEEIEKRFSEADNLEKAIDESLEKSDRLRQSILKQAFEGKLVN